MYQPMQAMRLLEPKKIEDEPLKLQSLELPKPGPRQIRVAVSYCGVCHTDLHTVEGDLALPKLPLTPGHQVVGTVDALGTNAGRYNLGQRVGVGWLNETCGDCAYCQRGQENLCPNARFTGLHRDGGYGSYILVNEDFAFELPEGLGDAEASPLLCAGIIGYRSLRLSNIRPGGNLGLFGFGASAHIAIQVARYWDCPVFVFTRSDEHQRLALELGAVWVGQAQDEPPAQLDAAITFAPAGWIVPHALSDLAPGAALAINAIHMSPIPEFAYQKIYGERILRSVANYTRQDAQEFLQLAAKIPVRTTIEQHVIVEANQVLQKLKASQIRGAATFRVGV